MRSEGVNGGYLITGGLRLRGYQTHGIEDSGCLGKSGGGGFEQGMGVIIFVTVGVGRTIYWLVRLRVPSRGSMEDPTGVVG